MTDTRAGESCYLGSRLAGIQPVIFIQLPTFITTHRRNLHWDKERLIDFILVLLDFLANVAQLHVVIMHYYYASVYLENICHLHTFLPSLCMAATQDEEEMTESIKPLP